MKIRLDKNDILFSKIIRERANGVCEYCGKFDRLQCSHFHGRRKYSTRFDLDNACAVCFTCHIFLGEHPNIHAEFFEKRLGSERYEQLNIRAQKIVKYDKEAVNKYLKQLEVVE